MGLHFGDPRWAPRRAAQLRAPAAGLVAHAARGVQQQLELCGHG
jgi:hypothetical protein